MPPPLSSASRRLPSPLLTLQTRPPKPTILHQQDVEHAKELAGTAVRKIAGAASDWLNSLSRY